MDNATLIDYMRRLQIQQKHRNAFHLQGKVTDLKEAFATRDMINQILTDEELQKQVGAKITERMNSLPLELWLLTATEQDFQDLKAIVKKHQPQYLRFHLAEWTWDNQPEADMLDDRSKDFFNERYILVQNLSSTMWRVIPCRHNTNPLDTESPAILVRGNDQFRILTDHDTMIE